MSSLYPAAVVAAEAALLRRPLRAEELQAESRGLQHSAAAGASSRPGSGSAPTRSASAEAKGGQTRTKCCCGKHVQDKDTPVATAVHGGYRYDAFGWATTWWLAEQYCQDALGGHLVSVRSAAENGVVEPLAVAAAAAARASAELASTAWTGCAWMGLRCTQPPKALWPIDVDQRPLCTAKDQYRTWSDDDGGPGGGGGAAGPSAPAPALTYSNWREGKLNNVQWRGVWVECACMTDATFGSSTSGRWRDDACAASSAFVCKRAWPPPPIPAAAAVPPPPPLTSCPPGQQLCPGRGGGSGPCCAVRCCGNLCCPVVWRVLGLVLPQLDFSWTELAGGRRQRVVADMTAEQVANASAYLSQMPAQLSALSDGLLAAAVDVEVAPAGYVQRTLSTYKFEEPMTKSSFFPAPADVHDIVQQVAAGRRYDAVVTVVRLYPTAGIVEPGGAMSVPSWTAGNGWWYGLGGCCNTDLPFPWLAGYLTFQLSGLFRAADSVLSHEFGHIMEGYYGPQPGVTLPDLHASSQYGYADDGQEFRSWRHDFYTGQVWSAELGRYIGLNATVYGYGTPSHPAVPPPWSARTAAAVPPFPPRRPPLRPPSPPAPRYPDMPAAPPADAPAATDALDGRRYEAFAAELPWAAAEAACQSRGGHLASVASTPEALVVAKVAKAASDAYKSP
ncbi:hypothetical protein HXX76_012437 [Chlamydomonas incerta]|uniref:C-type lectin domain-containing protein n=1 Tax=Chlamydomonas incerta TaxID=51695 RepID=A0A835SSK7_CHLIN|nr:hypothetical protein HXX76_012437 [Chlamydomonas incerta]|eukprot:KAG2427504.1 hypothetical protein HXX76_012437 [Chlamydomonas incerta]